ncbi:hypothetical protein MHF_1104 [Mycoplasma haemofelis Ohio2]|uniref:Uncharacterized protein n=1 Tax=Mycoplasma haemofelis (strain Ohio2) TaxID=859194 RepID=F6FJJ7_MYCHI|nr:hypothetical protein MHF_1104 [Mycoplasma haemofelis Ohio2]
MNPSKFFVAGTSLAGGGGLVGAGVWYSEGGEAPSEEKVKTVSEKRELPIESQEVQVPDSQPAEESKAVISSIETGSGYTCHIFEVNGNPVNKVLREIKDQRGFLAGLSSNEKTFKDDVEHACKRTNNKVSVAASTNVRHVYVYQNQNKSSWVYSSSIQTQDWTKSKNFQEPSAS